MECWGSKADDGLILLFDPCQPYKKQILFLQTHYSNIPVFQYPMAFIYGNAYYL
jgi:hypothetical protein